MRMEPYTPRQKTYYCIELQEVEDLYNHSFKSDIYIDELDSGYFEYDLNLRNPDDFVWACARIIKSMINDDMTDWDTVVWTMLHALVVCEFLPEGHYLVER